MLSTFHAVWQPFWRDIYHLLPAKKTCKGKLIELTENGKLWVEYQFIIDKNLTIIIHDLIYIFYFSLATYLYATFQHQTCEYQTKEQYDRSHEILFKILKSQRCSDSLSCECIKVIDFFLDKHEGDKELFGIAHTTQNFDVI
jgi:hypothetical protein